MKLRICIFIILVFFIFGLITNIYINTDKELADVSGKLIRLHVVANSDSPEDQELKRAVRDEIINRMSSKFENLKNVEEAKIMIQQNLSAIESIAEEVTSRSGKNYSVTAELGDFSFPTKQYGNLTLPAGTYQALNVKIGGAEGQNWWCVMFPPLCFIDIAHGVVPENTMDKLKDSLTQEEYDLLTAARSEEEIPVKLRFKIVEIAKSLNLKIAKVGQKIKDAFSMK